MKKKILSLIFVISSFIGISQNDLMYASTTSNTVPVLFPGPPVPDPVAVSVSHPTITVVLNDSIWISNIYNWLNTNMGGGPSSVLVSANPYWITLNPTTVLRFKATTSGTSTYTLSGYQLGQLLEFTVTTTIPTGIENLIHSNIEKLVAFPNPTSGQLNISGLDINQKQMTITNVVGDNVRMVETNGNKAISVDVENLSPGVYFINSNNKSIKFIKE
jgi:hypothetical protein